MKSSIHAFLFLALSLTMFSGCGQITEAQSVNVPPPTMSPTPLPETHRLKDGKLFVFVGERIDVTPVVFEKPLFDQVFAAKYKIIQTVHGRYDHETIEFDVFDHYGFPPFARYKNALLFVSEIEGRLYHEKYQYFDVYKTKDGRWASCGDPYRFDDYHRNKEVKIEKLEFDEAPFFKFKDIKKAEKALSTYYRFEKDKGICIAGAYIEELFNIKKNGVLKARGLF